MIKADVVPGPLAPLADVTDVVSVFVGLDRGSGLLATASHPIMAVLQSAATHRLTVLEVQLPFPAPAAEYAHLQWARAQLGVRDGDVSRLALFLNDMHALAFRPAGGGPHADTPVVGVQTVAEGIPRILNPRLATADPGRAADRDNTTRIRLVLASDLDVVAASGVQRTESPAARTWRIMAICADWRSGVEKEIISSLDPGLSLASLTTAILNGKAVLLLLAHRPEGLPREDESRLTAPDRHGSGGITVYLDKWQTRADLGLAQASPLLRVRMRASCRPGAMLELLESLRETLSDMAPDLLADRWDVWYARVVITASNAALIQLTVRFGTSAATAPHPLAHWGPAEFSQIERRTLALAAAQKIAAAGSEDDSAGLRVDAPNDIAVSLVTMPDPGSDSLARHPTRHAQA